MSNQMRTDNCCSDCPNCVHTQTSMPINYPYLPLEINLEKWEREETLYRLNTGNQLRRYFTINIILELDGDRNNDLMED